MERDQDSPRRFGIFIVALHFVISVVHGLAHSRLHIDMNAWQSVYILLVITVLPLVSAILLWRARTTSGFLLLLASMAGSLVFGGYYHFIAAGADNVGSLGSQSWARPFQVTAVLLAITEAAGVVTGLLGGFRKPE
jgi:CHASE2 domain-containing sensor protein